VPTGEAIVCYFRQMKAADSIEHVLDRLSVIREELLSLERELERVEAMRRDCSGESGAVSAISLKIAL
jgi:hypothetical protein